MFEFRNFFRLCAMTAAATLGSVGTFPRPASAATSNCDGVKVEITKVRQQEYAPLVSSAMKNRVRATQVKFLAILESGSWSAAYVSTPVSDNGFMFFQTVGGRKQFREVWGGWADPSEKAELVTWAKKLGAPERLAKCFSEIASDG